MKSKSTKKIPRTRNWLAVVAHFKTGAGNHGSKNKYNRKKKHKKSFTGDE